MDGKTKTKRDKRSGVTMSNEREEVVKSFNCPHPEKI